MGLTKAAEDELDALAVPLAVAELRALEAALEAELSAELAALETELNALEREPEIELSTLEAELPVPVAKIVVGADVVMVEPSVVIVVKKNEVAMAEPESEVPPVAEPYNFQISL